jgi:hypothetical protein
VRVPWLPFRGCDARSGIAAEVAAGWKTFDAVVVVTQMIGRTGPAYIGGGT